MKFGLFSMNAYACSYPETAQHIAQLAEAVGFESLWAGEHVVLPDPRTPESRMAPDDRILDPIVTLTYLAAHTQHVRLGTGIIFCPSAIRSCSQKNWSASMCSQGDDCFVGLV
jgi:alkanesulfonate monooxygenase SsuD/methylene tetrahydromethanopterin reductase-like flavin-dependent oxidoreductase (luciferase family)